MDLEWTSKAIVVVNGRKYRCYCTRYGVEAYTGDLDGGDYEGRSHKVYAGGAVHDDTAPAMVKWELDKMARAVVAHAYGVATHEV